MNGSDDEDEMMIMMMMILLANTKIAFIHHRKGCFTSIILCRASTARFSEPEERW